jgi:hypothetical protein
MQITEDVPNAVAVLLDRRAGFVTDQTLDICGGMTVGAAGNFFWEQAQPARSRPRRRGCDFTGSPVRPAALQFRRLGAG